jgi:hypothetical protein
VSEKKAYLLRLDAQLHDSLQKWAADELRSVNAQIEFALRRALQDAGRMPAGPPPARATRARKA